MQVVLATRNAGKLREVRAILAGLPLELVALPDAVALPPEGDAYEANAVDKAVAAARATGCLAIADDSGLEVDALGGAPGPALRALRPRRRGAHRADAGGARGGP